MTGLVLMLNTALAYVFMLMFWGPHLLSAWYAYACAYALVKTSLRACLYGEVLSLVGGLPSLPSHPRRYKFSYISL